MSRLVQRRVAIGDWVALQMGSTISTGHVADIDNGYCQIALEEKAASGTRPQETVSVPMGQLCRLGLARWAAAISSSDPRS